MSETKHTPGPWRFVRGYDNSNAVITGEGYGLECVALVKSTSCPQSDARLIAAAPELLEALKHCYDLLGRYEINRVDGDQIADEAMSIVRSAITKATGEEMP